MKEYSIMLIFICSETVRTKVYHLNEKYTKMEAGLMCHRARFDVLQAHYEWEWAGLMLWCWSLTSHMFRGTISFWWGTFCFCAVVTSEWRVEMLYHDAFYLSTLLFLLGSSTPYNHQEAWVKDLIDYGALVLHVNKYSVFKNPIGSHSPLQSLFLDW